MPVDPESYAASLYRVLHALDDLGARELVVQRPPQGPAWEAVADRLRKAASDG
jgi:L-threonylcarbamoyladenylate synthase